jgi:hypothetical protein
MSSLACLMSGGNNMEFRVRKTDDIDNKWVVANGDTITTTHYYIQPNGGSFACYKSYETEAEAQAAFDLYLEEQRPQGNKSMREYVGGATRDTDQNKLDHEGFNNPLVDKCYAEYLHKHRQTANGLRDSDNWQSLFGDKHTDVCIKSLCRHVIDVRLAHRGYKSEQPIKDGLCAIIFNAKAYLLKLLLDEMNYEAAIDHEIGTKPDLRMKP